MVDLRATSARQAEFTGQDIFESDMPSDAEWLQLNDISKG